MLTILNISSEEADRLNCERYHYTCPIVQKRLHAVYIKAVIGLSNEKVGDIVGAHRNSVRDWVAIYRHKGIDGLTQVNYGTNTSILEGKVACIKELFMACPPRSIREIAFRFS